MSEATNYYFQYSAAAEVHCVQLPISSIDLRNHLISCLRLYYTACI